jgi:hypothetical protein
MDKNPDEKAKTEQHECILPRGCTKRVQNLHRPDGRTCTAHARTRRDHGRRYGSQEPSHGIAPTYS